MTHTIAILGAGAIGTFFAHRFARSGHAVTVIARGARLEALRRAEGTIVARDAGTAKVAVADTLDDTAPDLLLVTVRRQHADALLPALRASRARHVAFVFNAAGDLSRFRDAVSKERFVWLFPAVIARLEGDELVASVVPEALRLAQITTMGGLAGDAPAALELLRGLLGEARVPVRVIDDMGAWLATHAAFMAPLVAAGALPRLSWTEAMLAATAMDGGFDAIRTSGARVIPATMAALAAVPTTAKALALWLAFRAPATRRSLAGAHARGEALAMLDDLAALAGPRAAPLSALARAIRERASEPPTI